MRLLLAALSFFGLFSSVSSQWGLGGYGYGYPGYGYGMTGLGMNPYMTGMMNPLMMNGMCMDLDTQCPIWASTGQCATNPLYMQRMCSRSCGTCALQMGLGGYNGLLGGYGTLGRSIYETGILRTQPKTSVHPLKDIKSKLSSSKLPVRN